MSEPKELNNPWLPVAVSGGVPVGNPVDVSLGKLAFGVPGSSVPTSTGLLRALKSMPLLESDGTLLIPVRSKGAPLNAGLSSDPPNPPKSARFEDGRSGEPLDRFVDDSMPGAETAEPVFNPFKSIGVVAIEVSYHPRPGPADNAGNPLLIQPLFQ
jgi:hypothetical protein